MNNISNFKYRFFDELPLFGRGEMFNEKELEIVNNYCSKLKLSESSVALPLNASPPLTKDRKSKVSFFVKNEDNQLLFQRINDVIQNVNEQNYNMDLVSYEQIQYTEYGVGDKYNYHQDTFFGEKYNSEQLGTRKLSLTILLNDDFEGGEFQFYVGSDVSVEMKKGQYIAFPSYLVHRVTPVTKGIRKSLVIWVIGPKFK